MKQVKWFDRTFDYSSSQNIFPSIIERLSGTPARLEEKLKTISPDITTIRLGNTWTIKENTGHLTDLEPLWQGRMEDILAGKEVLRPTDLLNTKTTEANHNDTSVDQLLSNFRRIRKETIDALEQLNEQQLLLSALHPRLHTPMTLTSMFMFVADHDDHHLARITELARLLT